MFAALPLVFVAGTWLPLVATRIWADGNRSLALVPVLALVLAAATFAALRPDQRAASAATLRSSG